MPSPMHIDAEGKTINVDRVGPNLIKLSFADRFVNIDLDNKTASELGAALTQVASDE